MTNPPGVVISGGEIPCTSRLGGEQGAEDLGVGPSSSLAAHECAQGCPLPHPLSLRGAPCSFRAVHGVYCEPSGRGFSDGSCKELVSIFSRQSQFWEVLGRLNLQRVMKGNGQSQAPERTASASSILSHLPRGEPCPRDPQRHINSPFVSSSLAGASLFCLQLSASQPPPVACLPQ